MRRHFDLPADAEPTVIAAFQGWNDVSGAALAAVDHLVKATGARLWADIDPEDYYDFQVNQPAVKLIDGERRIVWRTTEIYATQIDGIGHVLLVKGVEPSFKWKAFLAELFGIATGEGGVTVRQLIMLGALPGEVPHTRPLPVTATSPQESTRIVMGAQAPTYEGPTGIVGVIIDAVGRTAVTTVSQWVVVPQYASGGPQPKAAFALVQALGGLLGVPLPLGDLEEEARAWERGVAELVAQDPEVSSYIEGLEQSVDVADLPEASGEVIAEQFEQFLRRRDQGNL